MTFQRKKLNADLAEELRGHIAERIDALVAAGSSPTAAEETARREFGNLTLLEERSREIWRWNAVENLLRAIRFALRRLGQSRGFTAICIATLALGLGANLAMFTLVRSVLLRPLPFKDADRLVALHEAERSHDPSTFDVVAAGSFADWQRESHSFADMALWGWSTPNLSGQGGHLAEQVIGKTCSWNLFRTLGVNPAYGRFFSAADDQPGAAAMVVLSWSLFQRRFGGDPSAVGQTVLLDNRPYTVIGVLPSWFAYPGSKNQLWTSAYHDTPAYVMQSHRMHEWNVIARLQPGVNLDAALAEVAAIQA
ncbi:MAG TPA: ABC transporter permease, partial [Bryobacteraceae bacterium]|nr:ABC transporter permease [Bryobacteraceae bacterium]